MRKCFIPKKGLEILYIEKGLSRSEIAKKMGVHKDTIRYWVKKYNIPIRKAGRPMKFNIPKEELERLYSKEKISIQDIAKTFNVSFSVVLKRLKDYRIKN